MPRGLLELGIVPGSPQAVVADGDTPASRDGAHPRDPPRLSRHLSSSGLHAELTKRRGIHVSLHLVMALMHNAGVAELPGPAEGSAHQRHAERE
jgi:hypothetical protein